MAAGFHLVNRNGRYYWRPRLPAALARACGRAEVCSSLRTASRFTLILLAIPTLAACPTLNWLGIRQSETPIKSSAADSYRYDSCSAICAQLNPNGSFGRWVEPVGKACKGRLHGSSG